MPAQPPKSAAKPSNGGVSSSEKTAAMVTVAKTRLAKLEFERSKLDAKEFPELAMIIAEGKTEGFLLYRHCSPSSILALVPVRQIRRYRYTLPVSGQRVTIFIFDIAFLSSISLTVYL